MIVAFLTKKLKLVCLGSGNIHFIKNNNENYFKH